MKAKKVLAMLMASAMIMGTSVTAFAAVEGTTITVNNLDDAATITAVQVIEPSTETETGWKFSSDDAKNAYGKAFDAINVDMGDSEVTDAEAQEIIWKLIWYKLGGEVKPDVIPDDIDEMANADQIKAALENLNDSTYASRGTTFEVDGMHDLINVSAAGVYAIKATTTNTEEYIYGDMAAYVSFAYDEDGVPEALNPVEVNAKKTTLTIDKDSSEDGDVVAINDTVTYTVNTFVPYFSDDKDNVVYNITDTLRGAQYDTTEEGTNRVLSVNVYLGEKTPGVDDPDDTIQVQVTSGTDTTGAYETFTIDLSEIAKDRGNANKKLTLTYQAIVKSEVVNNTVKPSDGSNTFDKVTDSDTLYTGKITMTKFGEADENVKLAGAEFVLYYEANGTTYYAEFKEADEFADDAHEYIFTGNWFEETTEGVVPDGATHIVTDTDGEAVVRGLDDDSTYNYMFKEVKAPEGYSINEEDAPVNEWEGAANNRTNTADMHDTKLSSLPLPSTGGIGTTLFTVGGCTIMVVAAGLYFVTRKKEQN